MAHKQRKRPPRKNQFGVTLPREHADLLRRQAARLKVKETTLAGNLLREALTERESPHEVGGDGLGELLAELRALRAAHHVATLKLLEESGMSVEAVMAWGKKHLGKR